MPLFSLCYCLFLSVSYYALFLEPGKAVLRNTPKAKPKRRKGYQKLRQAAKNRADVARCRLEKRGNQTRKRYECGPLDLAPSDYKEL